MSNSLSENPDGFWEALFEASPAAMVLSREADGCVVAANAAFRSIFGVTPESVIGRRSTELGIFPPNVDRAAFLAQLSQSGTGSFEFDFLRGGGSRCRLQIAARTIDFRGDPHILGHVTDITELHSVDSALRDRMHVNQLVLDAAPEGILTYDALSGQCLSANPAAALVTGGTVEHLLRQNFRMLESWRTSTLLAAAEEALCSDRVVRVEAHLTTSFGQEVWYRAQFARFFDGGAPRLLLMAEDITERHRDAQERDLLRAELFHAQKMEAVGRLAGGVAHDFNNILSGMTMELELLRVRAAHGPDALASSLSSLLSAADRAATVVRQLLLFSRRQPMSEVTTDLNDVVRDLSGMLKRLLGGHVELACETHGSPLWFLGDGRLLGQVITNLCVNGRDAMPSGGRLSIATAAITLAADSHPATPQRAGRFVVLRVTDSGVGMDEEVRSRLFEPFFTTKAPGHGSGLGLATAHGIVQQHRGWFDVDTQVFGGSTFSVFLPEVAAPSATVVPQAEPEPPGGDERILFVEDNPAVRKSTGMCLRYLGYDVREAASGPEALQLWHEENGRFDLVLTDMLMPGGVTGLEFCQQIRAQNPSVRLIVASGQHHTEAVTAAAERIGGVVWLQKPHPLAILAATVRQCLDQRP